MTTPEHTFQQKSDKLSEDVKIRQQQRTYIQYIQPLQKQAQLQFQDIELGRSRAKYLRQEALANLDTLLMEFEQILSKRGVKVHWAADQEEAQHLIRGFLHQKNTTQIIQNYAEVLQEIQLQPFLESQDIQVVPLQLRAQIAAYLSKDATMMDTWANLPDLTQLYKAIVQKDKIDALGLEPEGIYDYLRKKAHKQIKSEAVGIIGADFMVANTGSLSISDNEGTLPTLLSITSRHIVVVALSQIIAKLEDLELFWTLRDTYKYAKPQALQHLLLNAALPQLQTEAQKPLDVVILDNGRSQLYQHQILGEALACIHCEACATACPVVPQITQKNTSAYKGAIGVILDAARRPTSNALLSHSTLCGACAETCPIDIPLAEMLRYLRGQQAAKSKGIWANLNPFKPRNPFLEAVKKHYFAGKKPEKDFYSQWTTRKK